MPTPLTLRCTLGALLLAATLPAWADDGRTVYNQACAMCHTPGLANAPKLGDKAAWAPRLTAGLDALVAAALAGKGAMPPKGGMPDLSEEKLRAAVRHMVDAVK